MREKQKVRSQFILTVQRIASTPNWISKDLRSTTQFKENLTSNER